MAVTQGENGGDPSTDPGEAARSQDIKGHLYSQIRTLSVGNGNHYRV